MSVSERAAARSVEAQRRRAEDEVRTLVEAALAVLRRRGAAGLTVADVLAEAGLSTRAFYRHFHSRDELVLAVYEQEAARRNAAIEARIAAARDPRAALETWIDEMLALGFDARRARRTQVLANEGARLQSDFPQEFGAILAGAVDPLVEVLRAFPAADPELDARSIYAITWELVQAKLGGAAIDRATAREQVLRFCLPAIGRPAKDPAR
jgi:AcrR family transcriptional regulator